MTEAIPEGNHPQKAQAELADQQHTRRRPPLPRIIASSPSFVYPVRSLLSGIQPAGSGEGSTPWESEADPSFIDTGNSGGAHYPTSPHLPWSSSHLRRGSLHPASLVQSRPVTTVLPADRRGDQPSSSHPTGAFPRALFHEQQLHSPTCYIPEPPGEPFSPQESSPDYPCELSSIKHPGQVSEVAAAAFSDTTYLIPPPTDCEDVKNAVQPQFNLSELGYVHLPPLTPPPEQVSERGPSASSSAGKAQVRSTASDAQKPGYRDGDEPSQQLSLPNSSDMLCASDQEQRTTTRYMHVEGEIGHHVVTGRKGVLTRCEDEPIRTPGAVQGFGVLIAVEEDEEAGLLVVRQVSENSPMILGLSPAHLFSLQCFTDTLPEAQADILWDNIQFLNEPQATTEGQENSPHVFLLTGWGEPGSAVSGAPESRRSWTCWCAVHRPVESHSSTAGSGMIILEFELERDTLNPLNSNNSLSPIGSLSPDCLPGSDSAGSSSDTGGLKGRGYGPGRSRATAVSVIDRSLSAFAPEDEEDDWWPTIEDIIDSTTNYAKPISALERLRRLSTVASKPAIDTNPGSRSQGRRRKGGGSGPAGVGMMDVFSVIGQINEQLGATTDLETCLKVTVGIIKDLTQFHRVMIYQFDEVWNGEVVAEVVDWHQSQDLYKGLHFPAADIPAQARELYAINTVRMLYDRTQTSARIVVRNESDLDVPLNMTHSYLRAMSPIHLKYLGNMDVRASLSVSIMVFGSLWGLVSCHSYGDHGMRVSFPVRQMLRLLSHTISRNIERLSYARRLQIRKLVCSFRVIQLVNASLCYHGIQINPIPSEHCSSGYVVSNADDLLGLFDADYGVLVIGEGAKILGPNCHGQEILVVAEYLRLKQFDTIQVSQAVISDYPDLKLSTGLAVIAGLLHVPLSGRGKDFITLLRKGQPRNVRWAGRLNKGKTGNLEPRKSFKTWSEIVAGRSRAWTEEEVETAGVLSLVYGKFIEVWRQKESAIQTTNLTNILLSNASHEVRTPLNHIINYLEMAMNGPLDAETRENLSRSHIASKNLLFSINDLLDLTRVESNKTSVVEPFDLRSAIEECVRIYRNEAKRRGIEFILDVKDGPQGVIGDITKVKTVIANLTANALKYTTKGSVSVECHIQNEPAGLREPSQTAVEIVVSDTGCGIPNDKLESIFREFEQVESSEGNGVAGVGLGLAVVVRIVEQLQGQLRVDSQTGGGSRFSFLIPLEVSRPVLESGGISLFPPLRSRCPSLQLRSRTVSSGGPDLDNLVEALTSNPVDSAARRRSPAGPSAPRILAPPGESSPSRPMPHGSPEVSSVVPSVTVSLDPPIIPTRSDTQTRGIAQAPYPKLRVLIVEVSHGLFLKTARFTKPSQDNDINRKILAKRLQKDGHTVLWSINGQEGLEKIESDRDFDCILMDIMMPILNGFESTERIREVETKTPLGPASIRRPSLELNGRMPIFAVSASLLERQRAELVDRGFDGWILKPIDFARLRVLLKGITDPAQRTPNVYKPGCDWELGGWFQ
ncbi:hypothetical protein BDN67DRAFT_748905 [Paxillus ammoniavirescens]|nr:hypothetical protein BDN67DRAFT_748905 [Paxillus ammoniavirescens]